MTERRDGWMQTDGYRICRQCNGGCDPGPAEYRVDVEFCCACCFEKRPPRVAEHDAQGGKEAGR